MTDKPRSYTEEVREVAEFLDTELMHELDEIEQIAKELEAAEDVRYAEYLESLAEIEKEDGAGMFGTEAGDGETIPAAATAEAKRPEPAPYKRPTLAELLELADPDIAARYRELYRMSWRARIQKNWRDNKRSSTLGNEARHQVVFNLTEDQIAILDVLASLIYNDHPHDPPEIRSDIVPSRQAAIETMINFFHDNAMSGQEQGRIEKMKELRTQNRQFFKLEACWRRVKDKKAYKKRYGKAATSPTPPWMESK